MGNGGRLSSQVNSCSRFWCLLLAGLMAAGTGTAQALDPALALTQYDHRSWNTEQGLPQNSVFSILQSRDGYLWLATQEGLARFDGTRFTVFDRRNTPALRHNDVWTLFEDRAGALWAGTRGGGLTRYQGGRFSNLTKAEGLSNDAVQTIAEDAEGSLWIGTRGGGLNRYRDGKFSVYTTQQGLGNDTVFAVLPEADGSLWIGTDGGGLNHFKDGRFSALTSKDGLSSDIVFCLYRDRRGVLWAGTAAGLNRVEKGRIQAFGLQQGLGNASIRSIFEDRAGNLWVGTDGGGLSRYRDGRFSTLSSRQGLSGDNVGAIHEDREGNLWVGTDSGGLNRLQDGKFVPFGSPEGLINDNARAVLEDRGGNLWVGSFGGLSRYREGRFTHFTKKDGLPGEVVLSMAEDAQGALWLGTLGAGLSRYQDGRFHNYGKKDGLGSETVLALLSDRSGTLWAGTRLGGLSRFRDGRFSTLTTQDGLSHNDVRTLLEDRDGSLWIGTLGGGINHLREGRFTAYTTKEGLAHDLILDLYQDESGSLWIGSFGGGLSRFKDGRFSSITSQQGLFDDVIYRILPDGAGLLWFSSNHGVFSVSLDELNAVADGRAETVRSRAYGTADGMRSREGNGAHQPAGWRARDGGLWFPTIAGVVRVDPARMPRNTVPPPVVIEEVRGGGRPAPAGTVFEPGTQKFEFHYAGLSLRAPDQVRFEYQLQGFDNTWVEAGSARSATYTNIAPGPYVFRLRARNEDGVTSDREAVYAFELRPHFYQHPAFLLVYVLGAAGLVWLGLRVQALRVRNLQAHARELAEHIEERKRAEARLAREAAALTQSNADLERFAYVASHDLREPLRAISSYTQLLQRRYGGKGDGSADDFTRFIIDGVRRMNATIDGILAYSRASLDTHAPQPADLNELLAQALANLDQALTGSGARVRSDPLPVLPVHGPEMVQVFQNLIENAVKYSAIEAPDIHVSAVREGEHWTISVSDNGIGIETQHAQRVFELFQRLHTQDRFPGSGLGLAICKRVIERLGGRIWVEPRQPRGSVFRFSLPAGRPDAPAPDH